MTASGTLPETHRRGLGVAPVRRWTLIPRDKSIALPNFDARTVHVALCVGKSGGIIRRLDPVGTQDAAGAVEAIYSVTQGHTSAPRLRLAL